MNSAVKSVAVAAFTALCWAPLATEAANVTIDPNGFEGVWHVYGQTGYQSGGTPLTVDLAAGNYQLWVNYGYGGYTLFSVDGTGNVTMASGYENHATGGAGSLTLNTFDIDIDINGFEGYWQLYAVGGYRAGNDTVVLPAGSFSYRLAVSSPYVGFTVDTSGQVAMASGAEGHAVGGDHLLTLNTMDITFDTNGYAGNWQVYFVGSYRTGNQAVTLAPGVFYYRVAVTGPYVKFAVDINGQVTMVTGFEGYGLGGDQLLTFTTFDIQINTCSYVGIWQIYFATGYITNDAVITLPPGPYLLRLAIGNAYYGIEVGLSGEVTMRAGDEDYGFGGDLLHTFHTYQVVVDDGGWPQLHEIYYVTTWLPPVQTVVLGIAPGNYSLYAYPVVVLPFYFDLDGGVPTITPDSFDVVSTADNQTYTLTLTPLANEPPVAACHDVTVTLDETGAATLTAAALDAGSSDPDNCIAASSVDVEALTCADIGDLTVTLTVTDIIGATDTCSATVTVVTYVPPCAEIEAEVADLLCDYGMANILTNKSTLRDKLAELIDAAYAARGCGAIDEACKTSIIQAVVGD